MKIKRNNVTSFWYANAEIAFEPNSNFLKNVNFKLDTGARITTIPHQLLIENGIAEKMIRLSTKARLTVADGRRIPNSYILRVSEIHVLGKNFQNFEVATSLSADMGFLLGQNILECFDWELNYSAGLAVANYRQGFVPQSISSYSKAVDDIDMASD